MSTLPSWIENALSCGPNRKLSLCRNVNGFWQANLEFEDGEIISGWGSTTEKAISNLNIELMQDAAAEMRRKGAA